MQIIERRVEVPYDVTTSEPVEVRVPVETIVERKVCIPSAPPSPSLPLCVSCSYPLPFHAHAHAHAHTAARY